MFNFFKSTKTKEKKPPFALGKRRFFCATNGVFARFSCLQQKKHKAEQGEKKNWTGNKNVARNPSRVRREQNK